MKKRQLLTGIFCVWLTGLASLAYATSDSNESVPRDPYKFFFNESWGDLQEELTTAKEQGKHGIFIFFEQDECPFCHYVKKNILNQKIVQEYFRTNFLNFPMDIEGDLEIKNMQGNSMRQKDFAFKEHRVRATPVLAFFDLDGRRVFRYTGKPSGVDEFLLMGEFVKNKIYNKMSFTRYKRSQRNKPR